MPAPILLNRNPLPRNRLAPLPPSALVPAEWPGERVLSAGEAGALLLQEEALSSASIRSLMRYHSDTADRRVPLLLMRKAKALRDALLEGIPQPPEYANDSADLTHLALWLYNITGQRALLALCRMLKAQTPDWTSTFHVFPQTKPVHAGNDCRTHGRTIASALRVPALQALFEGGGKNETGFAVGWEKLMRYHGAAHGLFNADPYLAGRNPSATVADETVAELLHTLHVLLWAQGDPLCADILEELLYNALPAARGGQAANQLSRSCGEGALCHDDITSSLFMATDAGGLAALLYAPCEVRWIVKGIPARVQVHTTYPHGETIRFCLRLKEPAAFALLLRIPAWAEGAHIEVEGARIPCEPGTFAALDRQWGKENEIILTLPMRVRMLSGHRQSVCIRRGPQTFCLPIQAAEPWNIALVEEEGALDGHALLMRAAPVDSWGLSGGVPQDVPVAPRVSRESVRTVKLVPYGQTDARIAQFPVAFLVD